MGNATATAATNIPQPQAHRRQGPIAWMLERAARIVGSILFSYALAVLVEWVGINFWWVSEGAAHSGHLVRQDLEYLSAHERSLITDDCAGFALDAAGFASRPFEWLGISGRADEADLGATGLQAGAGLNVRIFGRRLKEVAWPFLLSAKYMAQDAAIRLSVVALAAPAFLLALLLGAIDGLARRDIRKWSGGRESSYVYHRAKHLVWPLITGGIAAYLAWPFGAVNPAWLIVPVCVVVGFTASLMLGSFKKYL